MIWCLFCSPMTGGGNWTDAFVLLLLLCCCCYDCFCCFVLVVFVCFCFVFLFVCLFVCLFVVLLCFCPLQGCHSRVCAFLIPLGSARAFCLFQQRYQLSLVIMVGQYCLNFMSYADCIYIMWLVTAKGTLSRCDMWHYDLNQLIINTWKG